jgi:hypothetical protein
MKHKIRTHVNNVHIYTTTPLGASKSGFVLPPPLPSLQLLLVASLRQILEQTLFGELGGSTFEVSKCSLVRRFCV